MKYLLDTCVVSETRRREPNANLMNWLAERQAEDLFVSVVTDSMLAATALTHDMAVVTRNVSDFQFEGLQVINPFDD